MQIVWWKPIYWENSVYTRTCSHTWGSVSRLSIPRKKDIEYVFIHRILCICYRYNGLFFFFWYLSFLSNNSPLFLDLRWDARIIWNAIVGSIETHWRASFHQASTTSLISLNCGYLRLFSIWCKEITNCIFSDKWLTYCNFFCLVLVCFLVGT